MTEQVSSKNNVGCSDLPEALDARALIAAMKFAGWEAMIDPLGHPGIQHTSSGSLFRSRQSLAEDLIKHGSPWDKRKPAEKFK